MREWRWDGRGGAVRRPPGRRCRAGAVRTAPTLARPAGTAHGPWDDPGWYVSSCVDVGYVWASVRRDVARARRAGPRPVPGAARNRARPDRRAATVTRRGHPRPGAARDSGGRAPSEEDPCPPADGPTNRATDAATARVATRHGEDPWTTHRRARVPTVARDDGRRIPCPSSRTRREPVRAARNPTSRTGASTRARRRTRRRVARLRPVPPGAPPAVLRAGPA